MAMIRAPSLKVMERNKLILEKIQELKEENEKLKENKYDKFKCDVCKGHHIGCSNPTCRECIQELKEENRKMKEWLNSFNYKI